MPPSIASLTNRLVALNAVTRRNVIHAAVIATRFLVRPQLGMFASLLIADIPDVKCWIAGGEAPAFLRFEGPLYFMGPIWRIDWS